MSRCTGCCPKELIYEGGDLILVFDDCGEENTIVLPMPILGLSGCAMDRIELGKMGPVTTDNETAADLPLTPSSPLDDSDIIAAVAVLGQPGSSDTVFQLYTVTTGGVATQLGTDFTITTGNDRLVLAGIVGDTITATDNLTCLVDTGSDAVDLNVTLWVCVGGEPEN